MLRATGAQFERLGDKFSDLRGLGLSQLATGPACLTAVENIATQMKSLVDGTRTYGHSLESAAQQYQSTDHASAGALVTFSFSK